MAWTRTQLQALETAMQSGVLSVSASGKTVTYASFDAMRAAYEYGLAQVVAVESGGTVRKNRSTIIRIQQIGSGRQ